MQVSLSVKEFNLSMTDIWAQLCIPGLQAPEASSKTTRALLPSCDNQNVFILLFLEKRAINCKQVINLNGIL